MAILKSFECEVEVDGVAVEEYEDEDTKQANTEISLTKYIEVVSGAEFRIKVTIRPGFILNADYLSSDVLMDGKWTCGVAISSDRYDGRQNYTFRQSDVLSGSGDSWMRRKFRFADIAIGDKHDGMSPEELKRQYEGLGNITVEFWRKKLLEHTDSMRDIGDDGLGTVPEKALKGQALSVATELGPAQLAQRPPTVWNGTRVENHPVATFHFKYRSREALKQLLVIPRSPSPVPLEERDAADLTPEEARELIRRQKARLNQLKAIKKEEKPSHKRNRSSTIGPLRPPKALRTTGGQSYFELDDSSSDDVQIVKVEPSSTRKSRPPGEIEVIDLLD